MKSRVHINIAVSDLERSIGFYSTLFGTQPSKVKDDYANFRLDRPGLHLALVAAPKHAPGNSLARHYGIELFDNVDLNDWRNRLQKADMPLKIEEQVTCCYAVGNKFWAKDPDGNDWEFWIRTEEASLMKGETEAPCATGESMCCTPAHAAAPVEQAAGPASACCTPAQAAVAVEVAEAKGESACCTPQTAGKSGCC
jgi:predicted enzyme related to lactoylglutathione lyase